MNCWEFKKCGRQAEGANQESKGLCPAPGWVGGRVNPVPGWVGGRTDYCKLMS